MVGLRLSLVFQRGHGRSYILRPMAKSSLEHVAGTFVSSGYSVYVTWYAVTLN